MICFGRWYQNFSLIKKIPNPWYAYQYFVNKPENMKRLAAMEKAEREKQRSEWIKILDDDTYTKTSNQNLRIRDAILWGRILPLEKEAGSAYTNIDNLGLSSDNVAYIKATTTPEQYDFYMKSVSTNIIKDFKTFDSEEFVSVWDEEMRGIAKRKEYIQHIGWSEMKQEWINKIGTINRLMDIGPRMEVYKENYINKDGNIKKLYDAEVQNITNSYRQNNPQNYEKISQQCDGDQKLIDEVIKKQAEIEVLNNFKEKGIITLTQEDELSFAQLNIDVYEKMKAWWVTVAESINNAYNNALKYLNDIYGSSSTYKEISSKVLADKELKTFFDSPDNQVERFNENEKDLLYYKQMIKIYGKEFENIKNKDWVSVIEFIEKEDAVVENLQDFPGFIEQIKKCETWVGGIVDKTNQKIKEVAVKKCLTALQKNIDIDVNDQQNIIDQLELEKDLDAVVDKWDDIVINIQGKLKTSWEKIYMSYNLVTWQVYYHKYMQKSVSTSQDNGVITFGNYAMTDEDMEKNKIPFMKLPTLGSTISKGKKENTDYMDLMEKSEDIASYEKNLEDELMTEYSLSETTEYDIGKDALKKQMLQDMIIQKLAKVCRRTIKDWAVVSSDEKPDIMYNLYNYFNKSLTYYDAKSLDKLETWNTYMNKLLNIQTSPDYAKSVNTTNKRWFVLHNIMTPTIIGGTNTSIKDQTSESFISSFFQCFKTNVGNIEILDIDKMKKYFEIANQSVENTVIEDKKNEQVFNKLYADIDSKIWWKTAEADVEKKLELMDETIIA